MTNVGYNMAPATWDKVETILLATSFDIITLATTGCGSYPEHHGILARSADASIRSLWSQFGRPVDDRVAKLPLCSHADFGKNTIHHANQICMSMNLAVARGVSLAFTVMAEEATADVKVASAPEEVSLPYAVSYPEDEQAVRAKADALGISIIDMGDSKALLLGDPEAITELREFMSALLTKREDLNLN